MKCVLEREREREFTKEETHNPEYEFLDLILQS